ncbi:hypothetical protein [Acetobacter sp. DsW_063]|uniref:hypothetical protein n=1 Tax=Acetobacter sp. DsW_063 TaxID=1514894 RepID=UPI0018E9786F|nr:hypothetical protein [Acetobacter sp. DsW_063]
MKAVLSKVVLTATLAIAAPAIAISGASFASAEEHHHHHHHHDGEMSKGKTAPTSATEDLNARSLAAAQQDKVPSIGATAPTAAPVAPTVPSVAAGTGTVAPPAPATPDVATPASASGN